jgi:hypothetical protein
MYVYRGNIQLPYNTQYNIAMDTPSTTAKQSVTYQYLCPWEKHRILDTTVQEYRNKSLSETRIIEMTFVTCGKCYKDNGIQFEPPHIVKLRELGKIKDMIQSNPILADLLNGVVPDISCDIYYVMYRDNREQKISINPSTLISASIKLY